MKKLRYLLLEISMLFCVLLSVGILYVALDRNMAYVQYVKAFQGYETEIKGVIASFLRLQTRQDQPGNRETCYLENLYAYATYLGYAPEFPTTTSEACNRLIFIGINRESLPLASLYSDSQLYIREQQELEFRRNAEVRIGVVIMSAGLYEVGVQARCMGPSPALVDLRVANHKHRFSFENEPETYLVELNLSPGVHWITIAFINDLYTETSDRNLRLMGVWIEQKSES